MKKAVLLVSFGTSYREAAIKSIEAIRRDLAEREAGLSVYQAYTSGVILHKLAKEGAFIYSVPEALAAMAEAGAEEIYVISTHMIPGLEYGKMLEMINSAKKEWQKVRVSAPVLERKADCEKLVPVIRKILQVRKDWEYVLMGHGTESKANIRYEQMNEAFQKAGLSNVRIASVEARPDLSDTLSGLAKREKGRKVVLHPFMIVAGDHAWNDMAGEENSYLTQLQDAGYTVETVMKGLGEYPAFRQIFSDRLEELYHES